MDRLVDGSTDRIADLWPPEQAVALLLSLGIATGSVSDVIRVAKLLLDRDAPALPPSAGTSVERLRDHSTPPKVGEAVQEEGNGGGNFGYTRSFESSLLAVDSSGM